ncbi:MAG: type I-U CRISPR-associated protein Cas5/Cas6 [Acidobacteria bacterium]|nr:type I-U CRISPR-associated protein Cas5/Cas6 [Acidobacteriota bacterium]
MSRALVISVRFHDGRFHGEGSDGEPEWPPSPARLFQALVAGAGSGDALGAEETKAFEWLEERPAPTILAPAARRGQRFTLFVPNNDGDKVESGSLPLGKIRTEKTIQPHLFDANVPVSFVWTWDDEKAEEEDRARIICRVAERLYQLGRGVDMAWADAEVVDTDDLETKLAERRRVVHRPGTGNGGILLACPASGSLSGLADRFASKRFPAISHGAAPRQIFCKPPQGRFVPIAYDTPPQRFVFDLRTPGPTGSFAAWPLSKATALIERARDQAADRLQAPELAEQIARYLVGKGAAAADKALRVRVVPVPSIGHEQADQSIRRVAVYVPQTCPLAADDLKWAFAQVEWSDAGAGGGIGTTLQPTDDERMADRFEVPAQCWRSVTPLALPRRRWVAAAPEGDGAGSAHVQRETLAAAVRQALRHAGVRTPVSSVRVQREPFERRGERAERFAAGTRFPPDALWHAALTFTEPVAGPLLAGDGRYVGLGLMRPVRTVPDVVAFAIVGGLAAGANRAVIVRAARRAMMARVQRRQRRGEPLPTYVSGHDGEGHPATGGGHRHVAVAVDLLRRRLLYIAPSRLQRRGVHWREIEQAHRRLAGALEGMDRLRAGSAGLLTLAPATVEEVDDPLFAAARVWETVTAYNVTRHRRTADATEALTADIADELQRRYWPVPDTIEVLEAHRGPRGGLSGRVRISFRIAQAGPLLIGRTAHKGGGLFAGCWRMP